MNKHTSVFFPHPEGTEHTPCSCCGTCACDFHGGEVHGGKLWCSICIGGDHHQATKRRVGGTE